jgi:hypothetical protein
MMFRNLLSSTALAGALLLTLACSDSPSNAKVQPAKAPEATSPAPRPQTADRGTTDRRELLQDALTALQETQNALTAIYKNMQKDAIAALERATGKLEILLARTPTLALAPVDVSATTYDVLGDAKDVEALRDEAKKAIAQDRLQDARRLIGGLASETVISTSYLPLATYPAAIKSAAALLAQNKPNEAKIVLQTALSTIIVRDAVAPLPLVRAQAAIEQARSLSEKAGRTEAENARLRLLLATAREQVRFGQALGYATKKDMDGLIAAIDEIAEKTGGQKHGKGLVDRIEGLFDKARDASQPAERTR